MRRPWDGGVVSASSISTTVKTTGCHVLKINGYSDAKKVISNGWPVASSEFEAASHTWYIRYYPNGESPECAEHISLFLRLADREVGTTVVNAKFRLSLVPHAGDPSPPPPPRPYGKSCRAVFGRTLLCSSHGFQWFIKQRALERSGYLVDDCFAVRCDIDVVQVSADATVKEHDLHSLGLPCRSCDDGQCCTAASTLPRRRHRSQWFRLFGCGKFRN